MTPPAKSIPPPPPPRKDIQLPQSNEQETITQLLANIAQLTSIVDQLSKK